MCCNIHSSGFMILVMLPLNNSLQSKLKNIIKEMRTKQKEDLPQMWPNNSRDIVRPTDQFSL